MKYAGLWPWRFESFTVFQGGGGGSLWGIRSSLDATRPLRFSLRSRSPLPLSAGWSLVYYYVELPWRWMVSRGAAAADDGSGGGGAALRLMPMMRLEQRPEFVAAMKPTEGHPNCTTICGPYVEGENRTYNKTQTNIACDQCVCNKTGITTLTSAQQWSLRLCDASRERGKPNGCKHLDEKPGLVKQWGVRLCDTNKAVPCPKSNTKS